MGRETMSSLKATHEAVRITTAIIADEQIEFARLKCAGCGGGLDPATSPDGSSVVCASCGSTNPLPYHAVAQLREGTLMRARDHQAQEYLRRVEEERAYWDSMPEPWWWQTRDGRTDWGTLIGLTVALFFAALALYDLYVR